MVLQFSMVNIEVTEETDEVIWNVYKGYYKGWVNKNLKSIKKNISYGQLYYVLRV